MMFKPKLLSSAVLGSLIAITRRLHRYEDILKS